MAESTPPPQPDPATAERLAGLAKELVAGLLGFGRVPVNASSAWALGPKAAERRLEAASTLVAEMRDGTRTHKQAATLACAVVVLAGCERHATGKVDGLLGAVADAMNLLRGRRRCPPELHEVVDALRAGAVLNDAHIAALRDVAESGGAAGREVQDGAGGRGTARAAAGTSSPSAGDSGVSGDVPTPTYARERDAVHAHTHACVDGMGGDGKPPVSPGSPGTPEDGRVGASLPPAGVAVASQGHWEPFAYHRVLRPKSFPVNALPVNFTRADLDAYERQVHASATERVRNIQVESPPAPASLSASQQVAWRQAQRLRRVRAALERAVPPSPSVTFILAWWPMVNGVRAAHGGIEIPVPIGQRIIDGELQERDKLWETTYILASPAGSPALSMADSALLEAALREAEWALRGPTDRAATPSLDLFGSWLLELPSRVAPDTWFAWDGTRSVLVETRPRTAVPHGAVYSDVRLSTMQAIDAMVVQLEGVAAPPPPDAPKRRPKARRRRPSGPHMPLIDLDGEGLVVVNGTKTRIALHIGVGTLLIAILRKEAKALSRDADRTELDTALRRATDGELGLARVARGSLVRALTGPARIGPTLQARLGIGSEYRP